MLGDSDTQKESGSCSIDRSAVLESAKASTLTVPTYRFDDGLRFRRVMTVLSALLRPLPLPITHSHLLRTYRSLHDHQSFQQAYTARRTSCPWNPKAKLSVVPIVFLSRLFNASAVCCVRVVVGVRQLLQNRRPAKIALDLQVKHQLIWTKKQGKKCQMGGWSGDGTKSPSEPNTHRSHLRTQSTIVSLICQKWLPAWPKF